MRAIPLYFMRRKTYKKRGVTMQNAAENLILLKEKRVKKYKKSKFSAKNQKKFRLRQGFFLFGE